MKENKTTTQDKENKCMCRLYIHLYVRGIIHMLFLFDSFTR
jgi:uncharacterized membrane protein YeiB